MGAECVGCGYCCKLTPCQYGWPNENGGCGALKYDTGRYWCGIYDEIRNEPGAEVSPAFGAGCCSPLFNIHREAMLKNRRA